MRSIIAFWVGLLLCAATTAHGEPVWSYFSAGDNGYRDITNNAALERCATEARIGDGANMSMWERAIWSRAGHEPPINTGQFGWIAGERVKFTVEYDGERTVRFTLDGVALAWEEVSGPITDVFVRTGSSSGSSSELLSLGFVTPDVFIRPGHLTSGGSDDVDYLRISNGAEPFASFVFYGDMIFDWNGAPPTGSGLSFQTRLTSVIPAPSTAAMVLGLLAARWRRSRRVANGLRRH